MRSRQEIKAIGKAQFQANYWNCVLAMLLMMVVLGVINSLGVSQNLRDAVGNGEDVQVTMRSNAMGILNLLLTGPLSIGINYFFIKNIVGPREELTVTTPFKQAFQNYGRKLGGSLWMALFTFLWSLLFVIPGIIKAISYSMTQYILADCPEVRAKDALKLSMRMMQGHKWEYFVLGLSFLGWWILTGLTMGILGVFFVGPYMNSTYAVYYLEVRQDALNRGVITMDQLRGLQAV